jgi:membrane dipeptidase
MDLLEARALHDEVAAIDLHADTPKLMMAFDYDIGLRHEPPLPRKAYFGHVDLPRMREGGLAAQIFGLWTVPYPRAGCAAGIHRQLDALDEQVARYGDQVVRCLSTGDIVAAKAAGKIAALAGIEGGQALEGEIANVEVFARRGVRSFGLLHFTRNDLGSPAKGIGADPTRGLTPFGHEVIQECNRLGVVVDLAHINRRGFFEALAATRTPPMITHTGVTGAHEHWRNVDDEQLRAVSDRGGCVGVIFGPRYLGKDGVEAVADHVMHIINVAGEDLPSLGSDFDGGLRPPEGLTDVAALPRLTWALAKRGLSRAALRKILGENALRVLTDVPPRVGLEHAPAWRRDDE